MYSNVTNFEWYLSVLVDLMHVAGVDVGSDIRDQLVDIAVRVKGIRPFVVQLMSSLLKDDAILYNVGEEGSCAEVLWAAAWICGEYCEYGLSVPVLQDTSLIVSKPPRGAATVDTISPQARDH